jgi:protein gp37
MSIVYWSPIISAPPLEEKLESTFVVFHARFEILQEVIELPAATKEPTCWVIKPPHDIFHPLVPIEWQDHVMSAIKSTPHHEYLIVTNHSNQMQFYLANRSVPQNVDMFSR